MIVGNPIGFTAAGAGGRQAAGPNPNRIGLIVGKPSASDFWLTINGDAVNFSGFNITTSLTLPWEIRFDKPNDWITGPIGVYSSAAQTVNIIELVDRPA